ncbi:MAG: ABC transporter permease [Gemmataceae bacterium]|nr:ABC transporter permease [Gemmataceae bacterium]MDW8243095.1 ABC transporter permease [Thermogemmata sp.]
MLSSPSSFPWWFWLLLACTVTLVVGLVISAALKHSAALIKIRRNVALAIKSLWLHKLRSFLSVLGIIIGIASVISLMAFGEGSMQDALEDIKRQGATNIIVRSVKPPDDSATATRTFVTSYGLTRRDLERFQTFGEAIVRIVPLRVLPTEARYLERLANARVIATTPEYADIHRFELAAGRFLIDSDDRERKNVCVLGSAVADKLFPFENPLGRSILMRSFEFQVVGVIRERMPTGGSGGSQAAEDFNDDIYIPLHTSFARFGDIISVRTSGSRINEKVQYTQITLTVADIDLVRPVGQAIKQILEEEHGVRRDWAVTIPLDRLEEAERAKNRFITLMAMIASISLLVGGIGIMNIMLATVTERTREIGIRRALGAKRRDIILQFLVEAMVQTTLGGILGVIIGLAMVYLVPAAWSRMLEWGWFSGGPLPAKVHVPIIFVSLAFSILVGVGFGLYPAWRASRLDPIEALRHE